MNLLLELMSDWHGRVLLALMSLPVILLLFIVFVIMPAYSEALEAWVTECEQAGGHVLKDTDTHVGIGTGGNGQVVTTVSSDTDRWCLTEDGRILSHFD